MPEDYKVRPGDCITSLAYERGLVWQKVWNHPKNAPLQAKRKDPNILQPGDVVHLPDKDQRYESGATEQRHRFRRKDVPARLRLRIMEDELPESLPQHQPETQFSRHFTGEDPDTSGTHERSQPRANIPYVLEIDGKLSNGETNADGMVECDIPPNARRGRLLLEPGTLREMALDLNLGYLDPIAELSGIRQRLRNLGFDSRGGANAITLDLEVSLRSYQESRGLQVTGQPDEATRTQLEQEHGG
jgi:hypothetical protein